MSNADYTLNNIWKCQRDLEVGNIQSAEHIASIIRQLNVYFSRLQKYFVRMTDDDQSKINSYESRIMAIYHSNLESLFKPDAGNRLKDTLGELQNQIAELSKVYREWAQWGKIDLT
ncbi:MAG: hypothetical protein ACTHMM_11875 [Agriterribacter sp.]